LSAQLEVEPDSPLARAIRSIVSKTIEKGGFLKFSPFLRILKENFPDDVSEKELMLLAGAYGIGVLACMPERPDTRNSAGRILSRAVEVIAVIVHERELPFVDRQKLTREVLQKMLSYFEDLSDYFGHDLLNKYGVGRRIIDG
jgi:hypothetical protein